MYDLFAFHLRSFRVPPGLRLPPVEYNRIIAQTGPHTKIESHQFASNGNFKYLMITISVEACDVMWRTLKCFIERHVARKTVEW
jgi:hypothetical protein